MITEELFRRFDATAIKNCTLTPKSREAVRVRIEEETASFLERGNKIKKVKSTFVCTQ